MSADRKNANRIQRIMKARIEQARFTRWKRDAAERRREKAKLANMDPIALRRRVEGDWCVINHTDPDWALYLHVPGKCGDAR